MTGEFFSFVTPMFNASKTLPRLFHSLLGQSYQNWRIILIDDVSDEHEKIKEHEIISRFRNLAEPGLSENHFRSRIFTFWNDEKKWEVANVLFGISKCDDDDIICRIDADDSLCDLDALAMIASAYEQTKCDILWTQHRWGLSDKNISGPLNDNVSVYSQNWVTSHLKTFRKRLINNVPYENFLNMNGELVRRAGDQAIFLPCLHRAEKRIFLPRVTYSYAIDEQGGAVYQTADAKFQKEEAEFIRSRGYVRAGECWESRIS